VKWFYHTLGIEFNLKNDDRRKFRKYAAEKEGYDIDIENADFRHNGKPKLISGHMVNLLLMARYLPVDFGVAFAHFEWNLRLASNHTEDAFTKEAKKHNGLYEKVGLQGTRALWHTPLEYRLAFPAARIIASTLGIQFMDDRWYNHLHRELVAMLRPYGHLEKRLSISLT
jgi:hypothetical protein